MRKTIIATALLTLLSAPAWAGGIGAGVAFWSTDQAESDNGLALRFEVDFGNAIDFEVRASLLEGHEAPVGSLSVPIGTTVLEIEAVPVDIGLSYNFRGRRAVPYLGGGLSYVLFDSPNGRLEDEVGYYAVAGVDIAINERFSFYIEGLYRTVKAELQGNGLAFFDKTEVDFAGPGGNVGILFGW